MKMDEHNMVDEFEEEWHTECGICANSVKPVVSRDFFGQIVRDTWIRWAQQQPNPKPSWLVPYAELNEADKEVDRQIGETVFRWAAKIKCATLAAHSAGARPLTAERDAFERWWKAKIEAGEKPLDIAFHMFTELCADAEPKSCRRGKSSTAAGCDEIGCGYYDFVKR